MLISVDHGNKQVKTAHKIFTSGLRESAVRPALGEEYIEYQGRYYALTNQRLSYRRDKSSDESYFVLTLFAIAYEALAANAYNESGTLSVDLLIGLPPAHYGAQYKRFEAYFARGQVEFFFGDRPFTLFLNSVTAYPQAYAAAMSVFSQVRAMPKCIVVDIGGFTTDYLVMHNGAPDLASCSSMEHGVIALYNRCINEINGSFDLLLSESDVDQVLLGAEDCLPTNVQKVIRGQAALFVDELVNRLREQMIDLRVTRTVFTGGGALLLKHYLTQCERVGQCLFVEDIRANAKGYELLYKISNAGR